MSGAVTKTNKHNTNKEDIPNSSHLPFIGTADTGDSSAGYLLEICLLFLNPQLKTTPLALNNNQAASMCKLMIMVKLWWKKSCKESEQFMQRR